MEDQNRVIAEFRANEGLLGGPLSGTTVMLVHHLGARSGIARVVPLICHPRPAGRFVIIASAGGSPNHPAWYYNLRANPLITVEVGTRTFAVVAEELEGVARAEEWAAVVAEAPAAGEFQAMTTRRIPVFLLTPQDRLTREP